MNLFGKICGVINWVKLICLPLCLVLFLPSLSYGNFSNSDVSYDITETPTQRDGKLRQFTFIEELRTPLTYTLKLEDLGVKDNYAYSGMAVYLGMAPAVKVMENGRVFALKFKKDEAVKSDGEWTGYKGRFKAVLARTKSGVITASPETLSITWPMGVTPDLTILSGTLDSSNAPTSNDLVNLRRLKYAHLPRWMRALCRWVEALYTGIQSVTGLGWGLSLLLFAIVIKLILFPVAILTARFQKQANTHKAALEPIFADIKSNFKGETAHNKTMAAYKARGITPYYSLKPLLATMISLPVLIAIFNMLGEVEPLRGASAFWIDSFAYPDAAAPLPTTLPLFGNAFNVLPFLMAGVTFLSAYTLKSASASSQEISRQKRNLYLMGTAFFVIFYPFPSAMVLYWTLSTVLQSAANKFIKNS